MRFGVCRTAKTGTLSPSNAGELEYERHRCSTTSSMTYNRQGRIAQVNSAVGTLERLECVFATLIAATRSGELEAFLEPLKPLAPEKGKRAA